MEDWIQWFCRSDGHDFFCEVDRSYIESRFNLYGLSAEVDDFTHCCETILDYVSDESEGDEWTRENWNSSGCADLYGRIHARFILTARGQYLMRQKYLRVDFGYCPLTLCRTKDGSRQPLLPHGISDIQHKLTVKTFCPMCHKIFEPERGLVTRDVDGAYFGRSFAPFFMIIYPELIPRPPTRKFIPSVFGYKLHKSCRASPKYKQYLLEDQDKSASASKS